MEVTLIDSMGDDLRVVNAARVSFSKESEWENTKEYFSDDPVDWNWKRQLSEADQKLIKYLATHNHWTPFSHVQITLREKVPIFVARQRFKHTVGFGYNEVSRRYVDSAPEFYYPTEWRHRADNKKQGSSDEVVEWLVYPNDDYYHNGSSKTLNISVKESYQYFLADAEALYNKMIEDGVAPEQARMVLPQSMYTEYYCTGSLAAWARAYKLRSDPHAQREIQDLAKHWDSVIGGIKELEHSWKALTT
jgi:thymidylate synthase (FAD)